MTYLLLIPCPRMKDGEWHLDHWCELCEGRRWVAADYETSFTKETDMHYRNGRPAQNGDRIIQLDGFSDGAKVSAVGILHGATAGNDHCNGYIAPIQNPATMACLCDCLHVDDVAEMLKEKGMDKRPPGK